MMCCRRRFSGGALALLVEEYGLGAEVEQGRHFDVGPGVVVAGRRSWFAGPGDGEAMVPFGC
jgi:hypothetical protein